MQTAFNVVISIWAVTLTVAMFLLVRIVHTHMERFKMHRVRLEYLEKALIIAGQIPERI